jgi:hypothetical protein
MGRISRLIVIFGVAYTLFIIGPAFFHGQYAPYPLIKWGDVLDVLTPIVLFPLYWLLFQSGRDETPALRQSLIFVALAGLWAEGQGMHLSANTIGHTLNTMQDTDAYEVTYFFDEHLSHYLWHIGVFALSGLIMWRSLRSPYPSAQTSLWPEAVAALFYGLTYFASTVEAQTTVIGVPFAIAAALFGTLRGRGKFKQSPVLAFFTIAHIIACVALLVWFIRWGGLPEFSQVGIIQ